VCPTNLYPISPISSSTRSKRKIFSALVHKDPVRYSTASRAIIRGSRISRSMRFVVRPSSLPTRNSSLRASTVLKVGRTSLGTSRGSG